ncbi:hypothetical protein DdX_09647 [Ditylenchus destructor]|uniref:Uncharacterized protein n=1 Tax=Ditylenchus destructor TaxID=166010 RepID=A0AAD4R6F3_9BILA|nr:hypothetical protein DdX_09647 [Ditylenchus destructor]
MKIDESHVCKPGSHRSRSSFRSSEVTILGSYLNQVNAYTAYPNLQALSQPPPNALYPPGAYRSASLQLSASTYPLYWGYNRDFSLADDVKHFCNVNRRRLQGPYSVGDYNVSRYTILSPNVMYWVHFTG